jgi:NAD(P)-dependent dehydrogenase (short-subunit alcohol dehydrogenase family)
MLEQGAGVIVNNASVDGLRGYPFPGGAAYSAAKHGVIGLTRSAALENAKAACASARSARAGSIRRRSRDT